MPGLNNSRWALRDARSSSVPARSSRAAHAHAAADRGGGQPADLAAAAAHPSSYAPASTESAAAELSRYAKIVRRMKWKLPFLDLAYRQATAAAPDDGGDGGDRAEAELMFKLDFFEYYMLCERALVHLQGVFGIVISRGAAASGAEPVPAVVGGDKRAAPTTHRYHANVLEALDREDNPLHAVLGTDDVRWQLARAKDLRNRWKNADDKDDGGSKGAAAGGHRDHHHHHRNGNGKTGGPLPLANYDLAGILASIHEGLDRAFVVASDFVAAGAVQGGPGGAAEVAARYDVSAMDVAVDATEEEQWGFMVEAMDWEAV